MVVMAHSDTGFQKELVNSKNRSGILTSCGTDVRNLMAGIVNAYLSDNTSGRKFQSSKAMVATCTATTLDTASRVFSAYSSMPDSSYTLEIFDRKTCVRRSITSATTLGDGGRGRFCANARFESADARGVRANAERARVVSGSEVSSSSLLHVNNVLPRG